MGHIWENATCIQPKTCSTCKETEGESLGHIWDDATCTQPKTCSTCKETEGEATGHIAGEWEYEEPDLITTIVWLNKYCTHCGQIVERDMKSLKYLHENGAFLMSPEQFSERLNKLYPFIDGCNLKSQLIVTDSNVLGCGITRGSTTIGIVLFTDDENILDGDYKTAQNTFSTIVCDFSTNDMDLIVQATIGLILTCDPQLELSDAVDVARKTILSVYGSSDPYYFHDIGYALGDYNGTFRFVVSLSEN